MDSSHRVDQFIAAKLSNIRATDKKGAHLPGNLPFVTISSQAGAGGNRLANALFDELSKRQGESEWLSDWRIFDRSMCQSVLHEEHIAESMNELLEDEVHSQIEEFVLGLYGDRGMQNVAYVRLARLMRTIASIGKVIILGHGAQMATGKLAGGTHVRLIAPLAVRSVRMASELGISELEASRQIQQKDSDHLKLLKTHYHTDIADPELYDITCNTERLSIDTVSKLILDILYQRSTR